LDAGPDHHPDRFLALDLRAGSDPRRRVAKIFVRIVIREPIQRRRSAGED